MESQMTVKSGSPIEMIAQTLAKGGSLDNLEKLLEIQERYEANEARKAYHKAMSAFKENPPVIDKDKKVSFGTTKYNHASLSNVTKKINAALSKHGLSASWSMKQDNGGISVTCKITHEQGHSEQTTLSAQPDKSGSKNEIQQIGSTISYLERYSLLALTGLATDDADDDGRGGVEEQISEEEVNSMHDTLLSLEADIPKFLKYMGVEKLGDIKKSEANKAWTAINNKKKAVK